MIVILGDPRPIFETEAGEEVLRELLKAHADSEWYRRYRLRPWRRVA